MDQLKIISILDPEIAVQSLTLTSPKHNIQHVHDKVKTLFLEHISFAIHGHYFNRIWSVLERTERKIKLPLKYMTGYFCRSVYVQIKTFLR